MAARGKTCSGSANDSDFLYDFPCAPCEKDGRNVEPVKYCADCDENLCATCLTHHNRFAMTREHTVWDQVQKKQGQTKQLPSQRCIKHGGKVIDAFCPEHDTVGCSTCISVKHSSCKGKKLIPDVATGIKTSKELKELHTEMNTLKSKLDSLKKLKEDNIQRLKRDKDALKKEIQFVRKKMNEQLDKMEKMLVDEAESKFKEKIETLQESITEVDDMLARIKLALGQLKSNSNDADIFVSCKIVKKGISKEIYPLYARVEGRLPERSFELHTDENTKLILDAKRMFAYIKENCIIQGVEYKGDNNISIIDDQNECMVFAMCALSDGCLAMADFNNRKLKMFDPVSNNVSTIINLPDNPVVLCIVDNTRIAVSLINSKKIQFVSMSGKCTLEQSFSVGDRCRGLAHCDGLLYVCCGGSFFLENKEGRGHLEVYNCTGELLRCLYEEFGCLEYISVINDTMYISRYNSHKGVQVRGLDGVVKHRFPTVLNSILPFCLVGTDQLCIGEHSTGNIYIQTYANKYIIMEKKDVKGNPTCLFFDERTSRLFVALDECDVIKVFELKM